MYNNKFMYLNFLLGEVSASLDLLVCDGDAGGSSSGASPTLVSSSNPFAKETSSS